MRIGNDGREAEQAASAFRRILLIRRFEEKAGQLYAMGLIADEIKLCIGREALFTGLNEAMRDGDPLIVGRRCHGALLAFGLAPELLMSELANPSRGLFDFLPQALEKGASRPGEFYRCPTNNEDRARWAVSLAIALSLADTQKVVFVILDGDTLRHEQVARAMGLAKRLNLAIVTIIDHAASDPVPGETGDDGPSSLIQKALRRSQISFTAVDGIDPHNVTFACQSASKMARSGSGPQGLLVSTHAFRGHGNQPRRDTHGKASQQINDPVIFARKRLIDASDGRTDTAVAIETDVRTTLTSIGLAIRAQAQL